MATNHANKGEVSLLRDILSRCRYDPVRPRRADLCNDCSMFDSFLSDYGSNRGFRAFLRSIELTDDEHELKVFVSEYLGLMVNSISYQKFIRWNNYSTYPRRHLIDTAFIRFFGNRPKKMWKWVVVKGVVGKMSKSKSRRKKDEGTLDEYIHKVKIQTTWVDWFISNCAPQRFDCVTETDRASSGRSIQPLETEGDNHSKVIIQDQWIVGNRLVRLSPKSVASQMGPIKSYTYKYERHILDGYRRKTQQRGEIETRARRLAKLADSQRVKQPVLLQGLMSEIQPLLNFDLFDEDGKKRTAKVITVVAKCLRLKRYKALNEPVPSTPTDLMIRRHLIRKLLGEVKRKIRTWTSI